MLGMTIQTFNITIRWIAFCFSVSFLLITHYNRFGSYTVLVFSLITHTQMAF